MRLLGFCGQPSVWFSGVPSMSGSHNKEVAAIKPADVHPFIYMTELDWLRKNKSKKEHLSFGLCAVVVLVSSAKRLYCLVCGLIKPFLYIRS